MSPEWQANLLYILAVLLVLAVAVARRVAAKLVARENEGDRYRAARELTYEAVLLAEGVARRHLRSREEKLPSDSKLALAVEHVQRGLRLQGFADLAAEHIAEMIEAELERERNASD